MFFFFSFFWKKRQGEARNKRLINSVLLIQRCWRRHQRRRENAAVKIQSGKTTTVEARLSVFLPKQESVKFVLKTTPFATPLFSTNDHLLRASVVISCKFQADLAKSMPCQTVLKMTCGRLNLLLFRSTVQACFQMYPHRRPCRCAVFANICLFWSFTFFLILIATRLNFKTT